MVDEATFKKARAQAIQTLKAMGAEGGAVVLHPWRHRAVDGCTKWYAGLHVHAIVYGRVDADKRPAGTFVRTTRPAQKSVRGTFAYLLDHGGYYYKGHAVSWFGTLSYNAGLGVKPLEDEPMRCDRCGAVLEQFGEYAMSKALAFDLVGTLREEGGG
ncbi:MAG: hypothetical protein WAW96_13575 [Alphaproteobacteria bacterium]